MKQRNRLLSSTEPARIFQSVPMAPHKNRHILFVSLLAVAGIFLTSIVLATSEPIATNQAQIIQLPQHGNDQDTLLDTGASDPATSTSIIVEENTEQLTTTEKNTQGAAKKDADDYSHAEAIEQHYLETEKAAANVSSENTLQAAESTKERLDWQEIEIVRGDNLSLIFSRLGLTATDVFHVAQTKNIKPLLNLRPGQLLRVGTETKGDSLDLVALELEINPIKTLSLSATDKGFVAKSTMREIEKRRQIVGGEIQNSLFVDGQKAGMSNKLIMEMAYIFGWDIDFALDLRQGDSFKVIFNENYLDGDKVDDGEILAAEFINRGKAFRAVRYTDSEGYSQYYTPEGASMRKAFTRTPVPISRISSRFNPNRKHPVLKTNRPHRGVDYAAATGTPILATGDGKVSFVGNKGGYGRTVILSHGGRYTTLYAHMSRYKSGIKPGQRVQQGDVIGYIGSSGLATGPHLHYEFRVGGVHKNPLTVELPMAEALPKQYLQQFAGIAEPLLARLDNVQIPTIAYNID